MPFRTTSRSVQIAARRTLSTCPFSWSTSGGGGGDDDDDQWRCCCCFQYSCFCYSILRGDCKDQRLCCRGLVVMCVRVEFLRSVLSRSLFLSLSPPPSPPPPRSLSSDPRGQTLSLCFPVIRATFRSRSSTSLYGCCMVGAVHADRLQGKAYSHSWSTHTLQLRFIWSMCVYER